MSTHAERLKALEEKFNPQLAQKGNFFEKKIEFLLIFVKKGPMNPPKKSFESNEINENSKIQKKSVGLFGSDSSDDSSEDDSSEDDIPDIDFCIKNF